MATTARPANLSNAAIIAGVAPLIGRYDILNADLDGVADLLDRAIVGLLAAQHEASALGDGRLRADLVDWTGALQRVHAALQTECNPF